VSLPGMSYRDYVEVRLDFLVTTFGSFTLSFFKVLNTPEMWKIEGEIAVFAKLFFGEL
jgi:hypothetical protein